MLLNSGQPFMPREEVLLRYEEMMAGNTAPVYIGPEHYRAFVRLRASEFENLIHAATRAQGKVLAHVLHVAKRDGCPNYFTHLVRDTLFIVAVGVGWFDDFGRLSFRRRYGPRPSAKTYSKIAQKIAEAHEAIERAATTFTSEVLAVTKTSTKKVKVICSFEDSDPQASAKPATRAPRFLN